MDLCSDCQVFIDWLLPADPALFPVMQPYGPAFRVTFNPHKHGHWHLSPFQWTSGEPGLDAVLCLLDTRHFVPTLNQNL